MIHPAPQTAIFPRGTDSSLEVRCNSGRSPGSTWKLATLLPTVDPLEKMPTLEVACMALHLCWASFPKLYPPQTLYPQTSEISHVGAGNCVCHVVKQTHPQIVLRRNARSGLLPRSGPQLGLLDLLRNSSVLGTGYLSILNKAPDNKG